MQLPDPQSTEPIDSIPPLECVAGTKTELPSQDELRLSDPQGIPEAQRIVRSRISPNIVETKPEPRGQFTIASIMILSLFLCIGLSGASWMPATVFAGVVGASLLLVIFSAITSPSDTALSYTVWIGIILAYAAACVVALLRLTE